MSGSMGQLSDRRGINASGLAVLPDELLLEIVSYLPSLSEPSEKHTPMDARLYVRQRDLLLGLSRSCRNFRRFFRPYVWRRLEVTAGMRVGKIELRRLHGKKVEEAYATEVVRQLEIVTIRDPSLAEYVEIVNFEISNFSINSVLAELGRSLSLFPNLHTVKLDMHHPQRWDRSSINGFEGCVYVNVRRVILAPRAYPFLASCPNVKSVQCIGLAHDADQLLEYLRDMPSVESVGHAFRLSRLPDAAGAIPNLRQLKISCEFDGYLPSEYLEKLLDSIPLMQQLEEITLEIPSSFSYEIGKYILHIAGQRLQILHERDGGQKRIRVVDPYLGLNLQSLAVDIPSVGMP